MRVQNDRVGSCIDYGFLPMKNGLMICGLDSIYLRDLWFKINGNHIYGMMCICNIPTKADRDNVVQLIDIYGKFSVECEYIGYYIPDMIGLFRFGPSTLMRIYVLKMDIDWESIKVL